MLDRSLREELDRELGWHDLRAARVRVAAFRALSSPRPVPSPASRVWVSAATAVLGMIAGMLFGLLVLTPRSAPPVVARPRAEAAPPRGGVRRDEAREAVRIAAEPDGRTVYDARARSVDLAVGDARIHARGALFAVAIEAGMFEVTVSEGAVEIEAERQHIAVRAGESARLRIPRAERDERPASAEELLDRANAARRAGDLPRAEALLREALDQHPDGAVRAVTLFALGRVERARGAARAASDAYLRCEAAAPTDALADDALAEAAESLAGVDPPRARALAERYLATRPQGAHRRRMREVLGR